MRNNGTLINTADWREGILNLDSRRAAYIGLLSRVYLVTEDTDQTKQNLFELFAKSRFGSCVLFEMCKAGCNKKVELSYYSGETRREAGENIVTEIKQNPAERIMFDPKGRWVVVLSQKWQTLQVSIWDLK